MLTKSNKILIVCLTLLLALSVGYALFSDNITISGVSHTNTSFDITVECAPGVDSVLVDNGFVTSSGDNGFSNDECSVPSFSSREPNEVAFSTSFSHPGAQRTFTIKAKNMSNVPAKLSNTQHKLGLCTAGKDETLAAPKLDGTENRENCAIAPGTLTVFQNNFSSSLDMNEIAVESDGTLYPIDADSELILYPNETAYFTVSLNIDNLNNGGNVLNAKIGSQINLLFEQYIK